HGGSDDFSRARSGASATYNILRYGANYDRVLRHDWRLRANFNGQATRDALVPGEQFGVGGASSVRGFNEREVASDSGFMGSLELYTPNLCTASSATQCRTLAFYDAANVSRNRTLPGEQVRTSIASVGLGLRVNVDKSFSVQMDYGQVIDGSDTRAKGDKRLHVKASLSY
ncbi:MAG TPA: peptidase S37, partial [Oxalobacteraceae bacterium]|nr:peptidase S37 [Oxalobacteraceae bacterium]